MTNFQTRVCGVVLAAWFGPMSIFVAVSPATGQAPQLQFATPTDEGAEQEDRYAVPPTQDVGELMKFIQGVQQYRPQSQADFDQHQAKRLPALKAAAERIVQLEKDKSSEAYQAADGILMQLRIGSIGAAPVDQQRAILDEIAERLTTVPENPLNVYLALTVIPNLARSPNPGLAAEAKTRFAKLLRSSIEGIGKRLEAEPSVLPAARGVAQLLEQSGNTELAMLANKRFGEVLVKQENPQLVQLGKGMEGVARRLGLVGSEMELAGTTVDGKPFDWKAFRGRVVLVDFWATWCGPCLAELPNVRKNYQLYHDRGFDVVGISLDQDREALEAFIEKDPLPWTTLYEEGGQHPAASYYGITGIPTVILVGRDGKVISLQARGPQLGQLLEELLGPAADPAS